MNRNDFNIVVLDSGEVYVAQGRPALEALMDRAPFAAVETGLYHSQMRHRVAIRHRAIGDPSHMAVMTPSAAETWDGAEIINCNPRGRRCTSTPLLVGKFPERV